MESVLGLSVGSWIFNSPIRNLKAKCASGINSRLRIVVLRDVSGFHSLSERERPARQALAKLDELRMPGFSGRGVGAGGRERQGLGARMPGSFGQGAEERRTIPGPPDGGGRTTWPPSSCVYARAGERGPDAWLVPGVLRSSFCPSPLRGRAPP